MIKMNFLTLDIHNIELADPLSSTNPLRPAVVNKKYKTT